MTETPNRDPSGRSRASARGRQGYRSAAHFIEIFRTWYGPVHKAFATLSPEAALALEKDLTDLIEGADRGGPRSLVVPAEYAEIVVTRS